MAPEFSPLGKKVEVPKVKPKPRQLKPGILIDADGRMSTNLPLPPSPPLPLPIIIEIWP